MLATHDTQDDAPTALAADEPSGRSNLPSPQPMPQPIPHPTQPAQSAQPISANWPIPFPFRVTRHEEQPTTQPAQPPFANSIVSFPFPFRVARHDEQPTTQPAQPAQPISAIETATVDRYPLDDDFDQVNSTFLQETHPYYGDNQSAPRSDGMASSSHGSGSLGASHDEQRPHDRPDPAERLREIAQRDGVSISDRSPTSSTAWSQQPVVPGPGSGDQPPSSSESTAVPDNDPHASTSHLMPATVESTPQRVPSAVTRNGARTSMARRTRQTSGSGAAAQKSSSVARRRPQAKRRLAMLSPAPRDHPPERCASPDPAVPTPDEEQQIVHWRSFFKQDHIAKADEAEWFKMVENEAENDERCAAPSTHRDYELLRILRQRVISHLKANNKKHQKAHKERQRAMIEKLEEDNETLKTELAAEKEKNRVLSLHNEMQSSTILELRAHLSNLLSHIRNVQRDCYFWMCMALGVPVAGEMELDSDLLNC
eukprot:m.33819 g.33819  ORF g.33819 m.33819 type:complete len:484 (+) comp5067_c0_seq2:50-1501(+)